MSATSASVDPDAAARFLAGTRIALIGASNNPKNFASTIFKELVGHGYDVVPVNPAHDTIADRTCYPSIGAVPGDVDGAMVMAPSEKTPSVLRDCIEAGVGNVWLFKGIGGPGATSQEATAMCRDAGLNVVDGACPLMFLAPTSWIHRVHRSLRRLRGDIAEPAAIG